MITSTRDFRKQLIRFRSEGSESSLVDTLQRPKKRVRISFQQPQVFLYDKIDSEEQAVVRPSVFEHSQVQRAADPSIKAKIRSPWLTRNELSYFRSCAKKLCKSVNLDRELQTAYDGACSPLHEDIKATLSSGDDRTGGILLSNSDYSEQRGLERWSSSQHSVMRSIKITEVKASVLLEQSSQFLTGKSDPGRLAEASQQASCVSQRFAQMLATNDATEAMEVQFSR